MQHPKSELRTDAQRRLHPKSLRLMDLLGGNCGELGKLYVVTTGTLANIGKFGSDAGIPIRISVRGRFAFWKLLGTNNGS